MTEDLQIGDTTYTLKTALGWYDSQQIEQSQFRLFADGKAVSQADDIAAIEQIEIVLNTADANLKRLCLWLDNGGRNFKAVEVMKFPPQHVPIILARIEQLEQAQAEEIKALADDHPLMIARKAKASPITAPLFNTSSEVK